MTASLAELLAVPAGSGVAAVLNAADAAAARVTAAEFAASFAPPVRTRARCSCGSVFEARDSEITVTEQEKSAAADRVADLLRDTPSAAALADAVVFAVIAAINTDRADDDFDALAEWNLEHAGCGL